MKPVAAAPIFFGPKHRPLFGWLHRASPGAARSIALIICNPFGYEAICAHRTLRHLAERAAAAGYTTLRFDYDGSGDSAGTETDPDRLAAWRGSIYAAVDATRAATGIDKFCLAGMRLGATLASLAGAQRSDVVGFIAVAPVATPRSYLRELRALALARPQPTPPEWAKVDPDIQDIAGFALSNATRDELSAVNLIKAEHPPAQQMLLLHRNDMPQDGTWAQRLQELGATVRQQAFNGYVEMMLDAHENIVANDLIDAILAWLPELNSAPAAPVPNLPALPFSALFDNDTVRETALRLDADGRLFGIAAEPAAPPHGVRRVVIFLNAGAVSHVGPNRLHVKLARHLARHGVTSLRVDVSGIGESNPHEAEPENAVYSAHVAHDIITIRRYVDAHYANAEISLVGLCSGAYHGFKAAVAGVPLRRLVAINPLTFFWKEGMSLATPDFQVVAEAARYSKTAFELSAWLRVLRGQADLLGAIGVVLRRLGLASRNAARSVARRLRIPLQDDLGSELASAARHKVELVFVFAAADPGRQMLFGQGGSVVTRLQRRNILHVDVVDAADHTFTQHWAQARLMDILSQHLGAPPPTR